MILELDILMVNVGFLGTGCNHILRCFTYLLVELWIIGVPFTDNPRVDKNNLLIC